MARRPHLANPVAQVAEEQPTHAVETPEIVPPSAAPLLAPAAEGRIAAGASPTCRMISPGATACLGAGSEVTTSRLVLPRRVLDLVRGRVVVSLAPQAPGTSFGVATSAGTVTAVGTIFSVEILANGDTLARCERGEVVVRATGSSLEQRLLAGEQLRLGETHAATPLNAHDRKRDLALLTYRDDPSRGDKAENGERAERDERRAARNEKSGSGLRDSVRGNDAQGGAEARGTAEARGSDARALAEAMRNAETARSNEAQRNAEAARGANGASRAEAARAGNEPNAAAAPTAAPVNSPPRAETTARAPVRDLLGRARALRAQGAFRESADTYRAAYAADPHGVEGRTALVALGGLLLSELNDPSGALAAFDNYLSERKGALMQEAEFGRIRALRALGRFESEKAAIQQFLVAHPEGPDAQVLRHRLETMGSK
jgi:tetratricopeptide (TPR) repeat protein